MKEPKVKLSIIVPIYNQEKYLATCLETLTIQKPQDVEFILIDDGSTDKTPEILQQYARKDSRMRIITQENQGVARTRQRGIDLARGEWIGWCDPDDWLEPNALEVIEAEIANTDADIVRYFHFWEASKTSGKAQAFSALLDNAALQALGLFFYRPLVGSSLWVKVFRSDFIKENNITFAEANLSEDACFSFLSYVRAHKIKTIPYNLYHYRIREGSLCHSRTESHLSCLNNIEHAYQYLKSNGLLNGGGYNFWLEYIRVMLIATFCLLPKDRTKQLVDENFFKLKKYFLNRRDYKKMKKRIALHINYYPRSFKEKLFSVRAVGRNNKPKCTVISILGITIKLRSKSK